VALSSKVDVVPYARVMQDQVIDLILTIQRVEFGFDIGAADQPDLLDIENFYQTGAGGFWVALADGVPVGTIALRDIGKRRGALRKMFVKAAYRGAPHAVAETLLRTLIESATACDLGEIFLGTTEKFLAAHRFYAKQGFVQILASELPATFPRMALDTRFYKLELDHDDT
jgi:N-acetylglutamate synthase-like GNAT family acetyltransferase